MRWPRTASRRPPGNEGDSPARPASPAPWHGPPGSAGVPPARLSPPTTAKRPAGPRSQPRRLARLAALTALAMLGAACNAGAYPIDIFPEMHYAPAQRRLEPARLAPPPGAVPITGGKPAYTFEQAGALTNPVPATADTLAAARATYGVNCAMCHGADGHGDSAVAAYFRGAGVVPPVDLGGARVRGRSDGQLYWLITNGIGNMPPFRDLLTENEVWSLIDYLRTVPGP
jgi:mono/diheme cytochrome c family protein